MGKNLLIISYEEIDIFIGLNTRLRGIVNALESKGHAVDIACPFYGKVINKNNIRASEYHKIRMPNVFRFSIPIFSRIVFTILFTLYGFNYFWKIRKEKKFCVVQSEHLYPFFLCFILSKLFKSRVFIDDLTMLDIVIETKIEKLGFIRKIMQKTVYLFENICIRRADVLLCSSKKSKEYFSRRNQSCKTNFVYLPNGIDCQEY